MNPRDDDNRPICKFYLKGSCKHGLLGKKTIDGKNRCNFKHPKTCMKWLNNGNNKEHPKGCLEGKNCEYYHPRLCRDSLKTRTCQDISDREKCKRGYHLKNTTKLAKNNQKNAPISRNEDVRKNTSNEDEIITQKNVLPFPKEYVRLQILQIMKELKEVENIRTAPQTIEAAIYQDSTKLQTLDHQMTIGDLMKMMGMKN